MYTNNDLMEYFLEENCLLRRLISNEFLLMSWWRTNSQKVNDWTVYKGQKSQAIFLIFDPQNFTSPCRIAHGTVFYGTLHKYYYYNTATYSHILSAELSRSNEKDLHFFMISWQNLIFYYIFQNKDRYSCIDVKLEAEH